MPSTVQPIRADGARFVTPDGSTVLLRGVCLWGWLNMENLITGYSGNESLMRRTVAERIGEDRADRFFDRPLTRFFGEEDAAFLAEQRCTVVRIALAGSSAFSSCEVRTSLRDRLVASLPGARA